MPRRAARVDRNHGEVVRAARKLGFLVLSLADKGQGCPDLLLCAPRTRRLVLVEVKTPTGKLRPLQTEFAALWPVTVVREVSDLLALLKPPAGIA